MKEVVILWWIQETRVTPNWKQVACRRIVVGVYDEKSLHFLIVPQVCNFGFTLLFQLLDGKCQGSQILHCENQSYRIEVQVCLKAANYHSSLVVNYVFLPKFFSRKGARHSNMLLLQSVQ